MLGLVRRSAPSHLRFSNCSRDAIATTLRDGGKSCFVRAPKSSCGNGVVDPGGMDGNSSTAADNEECDSGVIKGDGSSEGWGSA